MSEVTLKLLRENPNYIPNDLSRDSTRLILREQIRALAANRNPRSQSRINGIFLFQEKNELPHVSVNGHDTTHIFTVLIGLLQEDNSVQFKEITVDWAEGSSMVIQDPELRHNALSLDELAYVIKYHYPNTISKAQANALQVQAENNPSEASAMPPQSAEAGLYFIGSNHMQQNRSPMVNSSVSQISASAVRSESHPSRRSPDL